jgi:Prokaryotic RING finger family 1
MPGIFAKSDGQWRMHPVGASPSLLRLEPVSVEPCARLEPGANDACLLVRVAGHDQWAALVADDAEVHHNGTRIAAGLRTLEHRDALALGGTTPLFFTTEESAHVETFEAAAPVTCPRCRGEVHPGDAAVRCPSCGVMHHEAGDRNCWTYAPTCALCSQPTALDAGLRWTPEEL